MASLLSTSRLTRREVLPIANDFYLVIDLRADLHIGLADICVTDHKLHLPLVLLRQCTGLIFQAYWRCRDPTVGLLCYEHNAYIRHVLGSRDQYLYAHASAEFIFTERQQDRKLQFWVSYSGDVDFFQEEDVLLEDIEPVLELGYACWTNEEARNTHSNLQGKRFHFLGRHLKYQYLVTRTKWRVTVQRFEAPCTILRQQP